MKKALVFAFAALFICTSAMAQEEKQEKKKGGIGSFLKKVGEQATGINMSDETFAVLPERAKPLIQMEVVSCIGDSKAQTVSLILAVKAKQNKVKTNLGKSCGNGNQECITAYDTKGKTYEGREVGSFSQVVTPKENPMGIPIQYEFQFSSVPETLKAFEVTYVEFYIHGETNAGSNMSDVGPIQIRNIPIQWDIVSE